MVYIGIDPGQRGALALIGGADGPEIIPFEQERYINRLKAIIASGEECVCCIEAVHAIAKQGLSSTWSFGQTYGWLLGILDAIGIPYQPITPQKWKKEFGLNSDKSASVEVCKRLYPGVNLLRTERSRKEDDGMAEACLLATYAKRKF